MTLQAPACVPRSHPVVVVTAWAAPTDHSRRNPGIVREQRSSHFKSPFCGEMHTALPHGRKLAMFIQPWPHTPQSWISFGKEDTGDVVWLSMVNLCCWKLAHLYLTDGEVRGGCASKLVDCKILLFCDSMLLSFSWRAMVREGTTHSHRQGENGRHRHVTDEMEVCAAEGVALCLPQCSSRSFGTESLLWSSWCSDQAVDIGYR